MLVNLSKLSLPSIVHLGLCKHVLSYFGFWPYASMGNRVAGHRFYTNRCGHITLAMVFSAIGVALLKILFFLASSCLVYAVTEVTGSCFSHGKGPFFFIREGF